MTEEYRPNIEDIDDENLAAMLYRLENICHRLNGEDDSLGAGHHGVVIAGGAVGAAIGGAIGLAITAPVRGLVCMVHDIASSGVELGHAIKAEAADAKARKKKEGGA